MMQPYRLAVASHTAPSCRDPPIRACDTTQPRPRRMEMLLGATFAMVAATGIYAVHAVGHGGHVEIAPDALAAVMRHSGRAPTHAKRATRAERPRADAPANAERALLVGEHDARKLVARAQTLEALGMDVAVSQVEVPTRFATTPNDASFWPSYYEPTYDVGHVVTGLRVRGLPSSSPLHVAGIADGDVILGIDGYAFEDFTMRTVDVLAIRKRGSLVVELARGPHHVVLSIKW